MEKVREFFWDEGMQEKLVKRGSCVFKRECRGIRDLSCFRVSTARESQREREKPGLFGILVYVFLW